MSNEKTKEPTDSDRAQLAQDLRKIMFAGWGRVKLPGKCSRKTGVSLEFRVIFSVWGGSEEVGTDLNVDAVLLGRIAQQVSYKPLILSILSSNSESDPINAATLSSRRRLRPITRTKKRKTTAKKRTPGSSLKRIAAIDGPERAESRHSGFIRCMLNSTAVSLTIEGLSQAVKSDSKRYNPN